MCKSGTWQGDLLVTFSGTWQGDILVTFSGTWQDDLLVTFNIYRYHLFPIILK